MKLRPPSAVLAGLLALSGCTVYPASYQPAYRYGPSPYATPPTAIAPPMQAAPPVITTAPLPAPGTFLPDRPPPDPYGSLPAVEEPPVRDAPPPMEPPAAGLDTPRSGSDAVTDLLLAPPRSPQSSPPESVLAAPSGAAPGPVSKSRGATEGNPMMGFRPMRGQTSPSSAPTE